MSDIDLSRLEGLFVGQLTDDEMKVFNQAVSDGFAYRQYVGAAGFMGLAKVALHKVNAYLVGK